MKLLKGTFVTTLLISGLSYGVPYEISNPLDPYWHSLTSTDDQLMCVKQNDESLVRMCEDNAIEAQEDHEYILMEEEHKH